MRLDDFDYRYILQDRIPTLQAKIDKINEKLTAANAPLIALKIGAPEVSRIDKNGEGDYLSVQKVEISREVMAPIGKIELLAATKVDPTTQFMEHRTFTKLTREEDEKVKAPVAPCFCDHCETNRLRIYIFTLKTPDGLSRVGSGCLDSFAGFNMSRWQDGYRNAVKAVEEVEVITFTEAQQHAIMPVDLYLKEAIEQIGVNGYRAGYTGNYHTGLETFSALRAKLKDVENGEIQYSPVTVKKAQDVMTFIRTSDANPTKRVDDYFSNLRALLEYGYLTHRQAGLLASSVISFEKEIKQIQERARHSNRGNEFVGQEKDKLLLKNLVVDGAYIKDGEWGPKTEIDLYDDKGIYYRWNATGVIELEKGEIVHVAGTLSKHKQFYSNKFGKDMLQNNITRCKFHTLEEIEELIATPVKVKKPRKAKEADDSPSP